MTNGNGGNFFSRWVLRLKTRAVGEKITDTHIGPNDEESIGSVLKTAMKTIHR